MKRIAFFLVLSIISGQLFSQGIPYVPVPDWQSTPSGHIATGLALADINNDGWKDIVAANGNDIQRQNLVVYYNNGDGTFPLVPSWSSADIDYHGHCAAGDINKDGFIDIAVSVYIGASGFSSPGKVKVYYNTGTELEATPSFQSVEFYNFSCALGDADADGDLDLAVAASESYNEIWDYGKVFLNNNGTFNPNPDWQTSNLMGAMDVEFGDMDKNGFQDLVFICNDFPNYIYLSDQNGNIDPIADWQSSETITFNNSLDIGYFGDAKTPGFVTTGNNQLGGDGKVRFYDFPSGVPANSQASWLSPNVGYGSGVILADVTRDGNPDLIYGGWWFPIKIIRGTESSFEAEPVFTSSTASVVEAIQLADLGREAVVTMFDTISDFAFPTKTVCLKPQLVENILAVYKNGVEISTQKYCFVPNKNWINFADSLTMGDEIIVEYEASADPDMVITNWDSSKGNYIFYNTNISTAIPENNVPFLSSFSLNPNPAKDFVRIVPESPFTGKTVLKITDLTGNLVFKEVINPLAESILVDVCGFNPGLYFVIISTEGKVFQSKKLIIE